MSRGGFTGKSKKVKLQNSLPVGAPLKHREDLAMGSHAPIFYYIIKSNTV